MDTPPDPAPDLVIDCVMCHQWFTLAPAEQRFFTSRGLQLPRRCRQCRETRRRLIGPGRTVAVGLPENGTDQAIKQ